MPVSFVAEASGLPSGQPRRFYAAEDWEAFAACHRLSFALLPSYRLRALLTAAQFSPCDALNLSDAALRAPEVGLTARQIARVAETRTLPVSDKLRAKAEELNTWATLFGDSGYPTNLLPLNDVPPLLFVRGTLLPDDKFSVAVVGSRRATIYGREQAERFARVFAQRGLTVVSGGAAGIDTFAHRAALQAGGRTIAVLGCGLDVVYPADNRALFAQIAEGTSGALVSEFPLETTPEPWRFPTRNRIIAGISRLTLLIETPRDSGALITARNAADYGRDVWAVPGPVGGGRSQGCHKLIQDGVGLADSPSDVLEALGLIPDDASEAISAPSQVQDDTLLVPSAARRAKSAPFASAPQPSALAPPAAPPPPPANLTPNEAALLSQFDLTPRHLDEAGVAAGLVAPQATVAATLLEMKNLIKRHPGGFFVRCL